MEYMHELKEKLCDELEEIARKPEMGAGDLEIIHKLTDTIKNIEKIDKLSDDGYSHDYSGDRSYDRASSYRRKRDSMGRYSRDRDYSMDYSRARDDMMTRMEDLMQSATGKDKEEIRKCMERLEKY